MNMGRRRIVMVLPFIVTTALSAWLVEAWRTDVSGYTAGYISFYALVFSVAVLLTGIVFAFFPTLRRIGVAVVLAACWLYGSFMGAANVLYKLDLVLWKNAPMVSLLPERGEGLYIYFRRGTTEKQIEYFRIVALTDPTSGQLKSGIDVYARVFAPDGRDGVTIGYSRLLVAQRDKLRSRITVIPFVDEVRDSAIPAN